MTARYMLADKLETVTGRVILVHGFNVRDNGKGTTDGLRIYFESEGFEVIEFDTGWRGLAGVRLGNKRRARKLAKMAQSGDVLIGHSDGCNLINMACWNLFDDDDVLPACVVYLNPALNNSTCLAPGVEGALVFHTPSDWVVSIARFLPFHPWGNMGNTGYQGEDTRYMNCAYEHLGIKSPGHSGAFKTPDYLRRVFVRIELFLQSL